MVAKIDIIGGGIGGLTTALTLQQKGYDITVYEGSAELKPVGAGIILANNAMQVFKQLGLQNKIEEAGNRISCMKITDTQLRPLSVVDLSAYEQKYSVSNVAIHRGVLQKLLAAEIGSENIQLSKRLCKIDQKEQLHLTFEDNSTVQSNLVIGADGIRSVVRNQLFSENTLRNAHQICWRGVCEMDLPQKYQHQLNEAWGAGKRFGFVKISDKKVYWYALGNANQLLNRNVDLLSYFSGFHDNVLEIIAYTSKEKIIGGGIIDLKPIRNWHHPNVCLVGDAAHATTPNLGQGACQAVEDAYILGKLLDDGMSFADTFAQYEIRRKKKAHTVVNSSWRIGKLAHIENKWAIRLRNILMKSMPKQVNRKQMDMIFNID